MQIRFARFEEPNRGIIYGFWVSFVLGGLLAVTSGHQGAGHFAAGLLLAAAFVLLILDAAGTVRSGFGRAAHLAQEISSQEYVALEGRMKTYPELRQELAGLLPASGEITYKVAYRIEAVINKHAASEQARRDEQDREQAKASLYQASDQTR